MLAKWVTCIVPPDSRDAFSAAQRQWSVISDQPGLIGQLGGWDTTAGHAHILGLWPDQPRLTPTEDPLLDALGEEPLLVGGYDRPGVAADGARHVKVLRQQDRLPGRVEDAEEAAAARVDEPRGQVAHVHHLGRQIGGVWDHDRAVFGRWSGEPQRPVAGAIEDVSRTADQADAGDQRSVGPEGSQDVLLAGDLGLAVGLHAFHDVAGQRR